MYHRILPRSEAQRNAVEPGVYVTPETFARHMAWLDEYFVILPLHEIVTRIRDRRPLPEGACAITFDDGWRDNMEHALPVLESRGASATIFAVTDRVGTGGAFWPDEVSRRLKGLSPAERRALLKELGVAGGGGVFGGGERAIHAALMHLKSVSEAERPPILERIREASVDPRGEFRELLDWDELGRLSQRGVDIEAHGASHAILTGLPRSEVRRELGSALRALRARGHGRHALFAYPSGSFDEDIVRLASEAGYAGAVTTQTGLVTCGSDPLALPRIGLHDDVSRTKMEFLRWVPGDARPDEGTPGA